MKKYLLLSPVLFVLASCSTPQNPPAASVTGHWEGNVSKLWKVVYVSAQLKVTDQPASGDFTGTGKLSGAVNVDDATITGNTKTGALVASSSGVTVTCSGTFTDNNFYSGTCDSGGLTAPIILNRLGD